MFASSDGRYFDMFPSGVLKESRPNLRLSTGEASEDVRLSLSECCLAGRYTWEDEEAGTQHDS